MYLCSIAPSTSAYKLIDRSLIVVNLRVLVEREKRLEIGRLLADVLGEIVRSPALARSGNQEPVVVKANLVAANLIVSVAVWQLSVCRTRALLQVLLVCVEVLHWWRCCGRCRGRLVVRVRIEDLSYEQRNPARGGQTSTVQVVALCVQAPRNLNCLCEITLVRNLDDVAPGALIVLRKHGSGVFNLCWTRCRGSFVARNRCTCLLATLGGSKRIHGLALNGRREWQWKC